MHVNYLPRDTTWGPADLNPQPCLYEARALTTTLQFTSPYLSKHYLSSLNIPKSLHILNKMKIPNKINIMNFNTFPQ